MKTQPDRYILVIIIVLLIFSCKKDKNEVVNQIISIEKEFETAVGLKGIPEAFYEFADKDAVIKRKNDTLIKGNENIRKYLQQINSKDVVLTWTPDFVDVSEDGSLAYTYGKFNWKSKNIDGKTVENTGVFHTIWKKQKDGSWKYVWD